MVAMVCICSFTTVAFAGMSVEPGIIEMIAAHGDEATGPVKVRNTGKEKTRISVEPEDWKKAVSGRRGGPVSSWLSVEPKMIVLEPGQIGIFTYHVKVAPDAAGENTAQMFFSEMVGGGSADIRSRVGVILYLAVRETMRLSAEIPSMTVTSVPDGKQTIITVQVSVANPGNVHVRPTGDVKIYDIKGGFVVAAVLSTGWGILPGEVYAYQGTGRCPSLSTGKYKAVATIQYGKLYKQDKPYSKELFFDVDAKGTVVKPKGNK